MGTRIRDEGTVWPALRGAGVDSAVDTSDQEA